MSRFGRKMVNAVGSSEFSFKIGSLLGFGSAMFSVTSFRRGEMLAGALLALVSAVLFGLVITFFVGRFRRQLAERRAAIQAGTWKLGNEIFYIVISVIWLGCVVFALWLLIGTLVSIAT